MQIRLSTHSELCEKMLDYFDEEEAVTCVAGILQTWVADGLFSGYCIAR